MDRAFGCRRDAGALYDRLIAKIHTTLMAEEFSERKFRETRLYQVAPNSTNLILAYVAEHLLGLPRSFHRDDPV